MHYLRDIWLRLGIIIGLILLSVCTNGAVLCAKAVTLKRDSKTHNLIIRGYLEVALMLTEAYFRASI